MTENHTDRSATLAVVREAGRMSAAYDAAHGSSVQETEHPNLAPITDDDLLRIANRPGGINDQLRAAMDARDHADGGL